MRLIVPKEKFRLGDSVLEEWPLYFLAGPIRGGGDWQALMCDALMEAHGGEEFVVACPSGWDRTHRHGMYMRQSVLPAFPRQLAWEQYFLALAGMRARRGCVIFWLGIESETDPHPGPEPYAMDTRRETGKWQMLIKYEKARVVMGADERFLGLSQIQRDFKYELGSASPPFFPSIRETAERAVMQYGR